MSDLNPAFEMWSEERRGFLEEKSCSKETVSPDAVLRSRPEVRGPGADSGSRQKNSGSRLLRLRLHTLKFVILSSEKANY